MPLQIRKCGGHGGWGIDTPQRFACDRGNVAVGIIEGVNQNPFDRVMIRAFQVNYVQQGEGGVESNLILRLRAEVPDPLLATIASNAAARSLRLRPPHLFRSPAVSPIA